MEQTGHKSFDRSAMIKITVLLIALILIAAGILQGEMTVIFEKSIRICLECLGIG